MNQDATAESMAKTAASYRRVMRGCRDLFTAKLKDYGPSWRMFRLGSLVDQIYIKARRIRELERLGDARRIADTTSDEYVGVVNYAVIALDRLAHPEEETLPELEGRPPERWSAERAAATYDGYAERGLELVLQKTHDYGEAWREMEIASLTDEILGRTARMKTMIRNAGRTDVSEGLEAQLLDTLNYAVFALIRGGLS